MHTSRVLSSALVIGVAVGVTIIACGGGGTTHNGPDAKVFHDAKPIDGPGGGGLTGLGQKCGSGLPSCPSNASACIMATGTTSFCTPQCETNGSGTTDAQGNFPPTGSGSIQPPPSDSTCTGAYTGGSVGTPACLAIVQSTPAYSGQASTSFTGINMDCLVLCGTGSGTGPCPTGTTCNTSFGACFPN